MNLPAELQNSYRQRNDYPKNLIPSGMFTSDSKLTSYTTRLTEAEPDLCLTESEDVVDEIFEIPMIEIGNDNGRGEFC